ncbi:MAG: NAD(P)/FAD-dependent oxidoreductase [Pseudomonadota bacterium]|nr:NAD(P)/FAD-dependent oxidoreductase [Pseudomonadota bacterium]
MRPRFLVLGGGPAGATTAAMLAQHGAQVTVVERTRMPRHHVGESLQPASVALLDRHLGLGPAIRAMGFPRKYGAAYVWGESRDPWTVLFDPKLEADLPALTEAALLAGPYEHAYNVERAAFDHLLLQEAARRGADVREEVEAVGVLEEDGRVVGARLLANGQHEDVRADFVVDASGQRCLVGRHFGLTRNVPDLQATATYTWFDGAGGFPGPLNRHVQWIVTVPDGWVWFIPIGPDRTSVGVVTRDRSRMDEARFDAILAASGLPLEGARAAPMGEGSGRLRFARDWSFTHARLAGNGWMLVGDAAAFVDPILSGGVDFAVRGGCQAALALLRAYGDEGTDRAALLATYDADVAKDYKAYVRLARYWYGNNRSVEGFFWEAHREIPPHAVSTPYRAFVYLTTGQLAADRHLRVFQDWQERKMFRALGVDADAVKRAARLARGDG